MQIILKSVGLCLLYLYFTFPATGQEPEIKPLSLLMSEIMFDPDPAIGLPECEYLELYNASSDTIELAGWKIMVGSKELALPGIKLLPDTYILVAPGNCKEAFSVLNIDVLAPDKWIALRNSGQFITLISPQGEIIHFCTYHPSQFEDALKKDGGWSLELADLDSPCMQESWAPSVNYSGGTPGSPNSVRMIAESSNPPIPQRAGIMGEDKLLLYLDRPVLPHSHPDWFTFTSEPSSQNVVSWSYSDGRPWVLELLLDGIIPEGKIFSIEIAGEATDCIGQAIVPAVFHYGIPGYPLPGEIVISEILFDPKDSQAEFVEICNLSGKLLALNDLYLATCDETGMVNRFSKPEEESFLMFPGMEYVLTADSYLIKQMTGGVSKGSICERSDMPSLANDGSFICIMDRQQQVIDIARYDPAWHDPRLGDVKGFSLERIRLGQDGTAPSNWHTASLLSGGSTPGMPNSQFSSETAGQGLFYLESHSFCPNGDGIQDYVLINIVPGEPGWVGTATVWTLSGNKIKELAGAGSLPSEGSLKWDGLDDLGKRVPPGYYAIILNYVRPDGSQGRWKDACYVR